MKLKKRNLFTAVLMSMLLFSNLFAQDANWIRKPIRLSRSRAVIVKGTVEADKTVLVYVFRARKNQHLTAQISSVGDNARFCLMEQEGDPVPYTEDRNGNCDVTQWSGVLYSTTIYELIVTAGKGKANFTLEVSFK